MKNLQCNKYTIKRSNELFLKNFPTIQFPSKGNKKQLIIRKLTIDDIQLCVYVPKKREIIRDTNCDSNLMISGVHDIGSSIKTSYSILPKIHLIVENTHSLPDCHSALKATATRQMAVLGFNK